MFLKYQVKEGCALRALFVAPKIAQKTPKFCRPQGKNISKTL
jgi:hypothetical protein